MFYSWSGRVVLAVPLIMGAAGCCTCSGDLARLYHPDTPYRELGHRGEPMGPRCWCEPTFSTLQPSTVLHVPGHSAGPAGLCRAQGLSVILPKKRRVGVCQPSSRRASPPSRRRMLSRSWRPPVKQCKFMTWSEAQIKRADDIKKTHSKHG